MSDVTTGGGPPTGETAAADATAPATTGLRAADTAPITPVDDGTERPGPHPSAPEPSRRRLSGLRARILAAFLSILLVSVVGSLLIGRQLLLDRVHDRIDEQLVQEVEELRRLADGIDPATGEPFGPDVERLFAVFLDRNIPERNEMLLAFVDGELVQRTQGRPELAEVDAGEFAPWATVTGTERGTVATPVGEVDLVAVPLRDADGSNGTFIVAVSRTAAIDDLSGVLRTLAWAGLITLALGALLAWHLADGIVRPVRRLTDAARSIGESSLDRRIEVDTDDELGTLAATINGMLDRLEAAFETQRQFIDEAGHELKTPLTAVRGHLEVMGDDPADRARTLTLVFDEIDRMARIVSDLLLLAKAEHPDFLQPASVDAGALLRDALDKARGLGDRDWELTSVPRVNVRADGQRLTQALLQLAQNAVQHTGEGSRIELGGRVSDGALELWVRDEGEGIPEEEQERVFERFHRSGDRARRSDGAGLGLAIVRAIAEAHGGTVRVTSRPGRGSTFRLVLPMRDGGG